MGRMDEIDNHETRNDTLKMDETVMLDDYETRDSTLRVNGIGTPYNHENQNHTLKTGRKSEFNDHESQKDTFTASQVGGTDNQESRDYTLSTGRDIRPDNHEIYNNTLRMDKPAPRKVKNLNIIDLPPTKKSSAEPAKEPVKAYNMVQTVTKKRPASPQHGDNYSHKAARSHERQGNDTNQAVEQVFSISSSQRQQQTHDQPSSLATPTQQTPPSRQNESTTYPAWRNANRVNIAQFQGSPTAWENHSQASPLNESYVDTRRQLPSFEGLDSRAAVDWDILEKYYPHTGYNTDPLSFAHPKHTEAGLAASASAYARRASANSVAPNEDFRVKSSAPPPPPFLQPTEVYSPVKLSFEKQLQAQLTLPPLQLQNNQIHHDQRLTGFKLAPITSIDSHPSSPYSSQYTSQFRSAPTTSTQAVRTAPTPNSVPIPEQLSSRRDIREGKQVARDYPSPSTPPQRGFGSYLNTFSAIPSSTSSFSYRSAKDNKDEDSSFSYHNAREARSTTRICEEACSGDCR